MRNFDLRNIYDVFWKTGLKNWKFPTETHIFYQLSGSATDTTTVTEWMYAKNVGNGGSHAEKFVVPHAAKMILEQQSKFQQLHQLHQLQQLQVQQPQPLLYKFGLTLYTNYTPCSDCSPDLINLFNNYNQGAPLCNLQIHLTAAAHYKYYLDESKQGLKKLKDCGVTLEPFNENHWARLAYVICKTAAPAYDLANPPLGDNRFKADQRASTQFEASFNMII